MRDCKKNQRSMKYALYSDSIPILDGDGNPTFENENGYLAPVDFKATLSAGKSDSESSDFGNNVTYDRVISKFDKSLPIDENSLIWVTSTPTYTNGKVDKSSADYTVSARPLDGLDSLRIAIKSISKSSV